MDGCATMRENEATDNGKCATDAASVLKNARPGN
jgi:hypothetical protein